MQPEKREKREKRENWVDSARVAAAIGVVFLHAAAPTVLSAEATPAQWTLANLIDSSVRWTVPVFVMLTGYLISRNSDTDGAIGVAFKRLQRIAPVLLFWNATFALYGYFSGFPSPFSVTRMILSGSFFHLWYLNMLVGLYVVSPFLNRLINACTHVEGWLLAVLLFAFSFGMLLVGKIPPPILAAPMFIGYYVAGHLIGSRARTNTMVASLMFFVGVLLTFTWAQISWSAGARDPYYLPYSYQSLTTVLASIAMFALHRASHDRCPGIVSRAAPLTLGIYLIHPVVLRPMNDLIGPLGVPGIELFVGVVGFLISWFLIFQLRRVPFMKVVT